MADLKTVKRIAIDVGGVIVKKDYSDMSTEDTKIAGVESAKIFDNALEVIKKLSEKYELWILSFAGANREAQTRQILFKHGFDQPIPVERWIFTRSRQDKVKMMKQYNLDLIIDDTWPIIRDCKTAGFRVVWFGDESQPRFGIKNANAWTDVGKLLL